MCSQSRRSRLFPGAWAEGGEGGWAEGPRLQGTGASFSSAPVHLPRCRPSLSAFERQEGMYRPLTQEGSRHSRVCFCEACIFLVLRWCDCTLMTGISRVLAGWGALTVCDMLPPKLPTAPREARLHRRSVVPFQHSPHFHSRLFGRMSQIQALPAKPLGLMVNRHLPGKCWSVLVLGQFPCEIIVNPLCFTVSG